MGERPIGQVQRLDLLDFVVVVKIPIAFWRDERKVRLVEARGDKETAVAVLLEGANGLVRRLIVAMQMIWPVVDFKVA